MTVAQRRQAERPVRAPVLVIANAYSGAIEKLDDERSLSLLARQSTREVVVDRSSQLGQGRSELGEVTELEVVALLAVVGVVLRLLSPSGIASCRLEVTARVRADPHISPGGRDGQCPNSFQISVGDLAAMAAVVKPLCAAARYTLRLIVRETKTRPCCHCPGSGPMRLTRARWAQEHLPRETRQRGRESPDQSRVAPSIPLVDPKIAAGLASPFAPLQGRLVRGSRSDERFRRS